MATPTPSTDRYCPSCGATTSDAFCPTDGVQTVLRTRLDVDATQVHSGDVIDGRYRVTGVLGRGGFGAVYSAEHTGTQQKIALKMMLPSAEGADDAEVRRFYREAQVTANLRHPNTVRVFDVGQTPAGALYIAMEMLHGPTLEKVLKDAGRDGGALSEAATLDIGIAVLKSLSEAHNQGLVHRDLKPANIMLTEIDGERVVKVLDFGIARQMDSSLTGAGKTLGTPAYMSPEQCRGKAVDARSDLYSLGIILYRCLAGQTPFVDASPLALIYKHAGEAPPDLRAAARTEVSDGMVQAVMRALAKDPDHRFRSARDMRAALEAVARGEPLPAPTEQVLMAADHDSRDLPTREYSAPLTVQEDFATVQVSTSKRLQAAAAQAPATPRSQPVAAVDATGGMAAALPGVAVPPPAAPAAANRTWIVAAVALALVAAVLAGMVLGGKGGPAADAAAVAPDPTAPATVLAAPAPVAAPASPPGRRVATSQLPAAAAQAAAAVAPESPPAAAVVPPIPAVAPGQVPAPVPAVPPAAAPVGAAAAGGATGTDPATTTETAAAAGTETAKPAATAAATDKPAPRKRKSAAKAPTPKKVQTYAPD